MSEPTNPIYIRPYPPTEGDDLFERTALIKRLNGFIERLPEGGVLAIDAPWGSGKTWFGQRWRDSLSANGFKAIYLDSFDQDYVEDPFLMISAEILAATENGDDFIRLKDAALRVGKTLLPIGARLAAAVASRVFLGSVNAASELKEVFTAAHDEIADSVEEHIKNQLDNYDISKKSIRKFKEALQMAAAAQSSGKIIFFVDELDRCKPTFAVKTIERIKHFFDVPGLIFVLLINRAQMNESIKGVYGSGIDADSYLGKFIQFSLTLPKQIDSGNGTTDHNRTFAQVLLGRYGLKNENGNQFAESLSVLAGLMSFSFRDIELAMVSFSLAQPLNNSAPISAWPIALKIKCPGLFQKIRDDQREGHQEAIDLIARLLQRRPEEWLLKIVLELHSGHLVDFQGITLSESVQYILMSYRHRPANFLPRLFQKLDLNTA